MKDLNHAKIVRLLAIVSEKEPFMIITEFMDKGDLKSYLKKAREDGQRIVEDELRTIGHQVNQVFYFNHRLATFFRTANDASPLQKS